MYFPREFKDKRIAKLERQLAVADSLHKVTCDEFYHLFKDELDEAQREITQLSTRLKIANRRLDDEAAMYDKQIAELKAENANLKRQTMSLADYYIDRVSDLEIESEQIRHDSFTASDPITIDQDDKDWPF